MKLPVLRTIAVLIGFAALLLSQGVQGQETQGAAKPTQLRPRPWTTSRLKGSPDPPHPYRAAAESKLPSIDWPICGKRIPGAPERLLVIDERSAYAPARLLLVTQSTANAAQQPPKPVVLLDFAGVAYDIAFHPRFTENGYVYIGRHSSKHQGAPHSMVSRYTMTTKAPFTLDAASEEIVIAWKSNGHNGAAIAFDRDGKLLVTSGDGTVRRDTDQVGQRLDTLRAKVLRIDVDRRENGRSYGIPADNPFVDFPGARPETWCYGLRNPWRITVDPRRGDVWVGNNGQDAWEQVYRVKRGANYGWSVYEGGQLFIGDRQRGPTPISGPTFDHPHSEARSLTGGVVYYGEKLPELRGAYIYGDYSTGKIWAAKSDGERVTWHQEIADTSLAITCFFIDAENELLIADHRRGGGFHRLVANTNDDSQSAFPQRLSETGLFHSTTTLTPAAGVIPYEVNEPAWHDGASAQRHVAIPATGADLQVPAQVGFTARNGWNFPDGSAFAQTLFALEPNPHAAARRLETRVMLKQGGEWAAYSYVWNTEQSDAVLAPPEGVGLGASVGDADVAAARRVPARSECMSCHSRAANYILGGTLLQLNRQASFAATLDGSDGSVEEQKHLLPLNQLDAFQQLGWLKITKAQREQARDARLPNSRDAHESLERRARAYLHANCKHCHVPDGGGNARIVLNWETPTNKTNLIDVRPLHGAFGIPAAVLVRPGAPQDSVLSYRVAVLGGGRMPRLGSYEVDAAGSRLLDAWIQSLDNDKQPPARDTLRNWSDGSQPTAPQLRRLRQRLSSTDSAYGLASELRDANWKRSSKARVARLAMSAADSAIRDLFEPYLPPGERVQRLGASVAPAAILSLTGDARRGRTLFASSTTLACRNCHQIQGVGKSLGPQLDQIGKKKNRQQLLQSLLQPSAEIDPKYATFTVLTRDGRVLSGLWRETDSESAQLTTIDGDVIKIRTEDIEQRRRLPTSLMPDSLLKDLTAQEAADLLAFLSSLK